MNLGSKQEDEDLRVSDAQPTHHRRQEKQRLIELLWERKCPPKALSFAYMKAGEVTIPTSDV